MTQTITTRRWRATRFFVRAESLEQTAAQPWLRFAAVR